MSKVEIYTDGSAIKNREGGYGIAIMENIDKPNKKHKLIGFYNERESDTTNNRMEMKAILKGLQYACTSFKDRECIIYSDSAYCVNMFNSWVKGWASNGWTRAGGQPLKNLDLVKEFYRYATIDFPNFEVKKISGHAGIFGNELADGLATNNRAKIKEVLVENGYKIRPQE